MQSGAAEASSSAGATANDPDNVASASAAANIEDPYASLNDEQCGGQHHTSLLSSVSLACVVARGLCALCVISSRIELDASDLLFSDTDSVITSTPQPGSWIAQCRLLRRQRCRRTKCVVANAKK